MLFVDHMTASVHHCLGCAEALNGGKLHLRLPQVSSRIYTNTWHCTYKLLTCSIMHGLYHISSMQLAPLAQGDGGVGEEGGEGREGKGREGGRVARRRRGIVLLAQGLWGWMIGQRSTHTCSPI